MKKTADNLFQTDAWKYTVTGAVEGMFLFLAIYGFISLIPTNTFWVYHSISSTDLPAQQIGFDFFRNSPWTFPPGSFNNYPLGKTASVIYSASVAPVAVFFKLFNLFLPDYFQYWGIWNLFCFILQGSMAALLLRKLKFSLIQAVISIPLFICNTVLLFRVFHHDTLSCQWLILFSFLLILYHDKLHSTKRKTIAWCLVTALSASIHFYFLIMIGIIMISEMIYDCISTKQYLKNIIAFILSVVCSVSFWYLFGGFEASGSQAEAQGLGFYSMNLLSLINPLGHSLYLPSFPSLYGQYMEDMNYLGLGCLILFGVSFILAVKERHRIINYFKKKQLEVAITLICILILTVLALSPIVSFGDKIVLDFYRILPRFVVYCWSVVRSTARIFWPVWYAIVISMLVLVKKSTKKELFLLIVLFCSIVQYMDVIPNTARLDFRKAKISSEYHSTLYDTLSSRVSDKPKYMCLITEQAFLYEDPALYAAKHNLTINVAWLARIADWDVTDEIKNWNAGIFSDDTIYCIPIPCLYMVEETTIPDDYAIIPINNTYVIVLNRELLVDPSDQSGQSDNKELNQVIRRRKQEVSKNG